MGDAKTYMQYHHQHCQPFPGVLQTPSKAGCEDADEQRQSRHSPYPLPGPPAESPRALCATAGHAPSQVACLILLVRDKAGGAGPAAWPRFV